MARLQRGLDNQRIELRRAPSGVHFTTGSIQDVTGTLRVEWSLSGPGTLSRTRGDVNNLDTIWSNDNASVGQTSTITVRVSDSGGVSDTSSATVTIIANYPRIIALSGDRILAAVIDPTPAIRFYNRYYDGLILRFNGTRWEYPGEAAPSSSTITPGVPTAPSVPDVNATAGTAIRVTLPAGTGGDAPLTYRVSTLPTGWTFNADTRELSGDTTIVAGTTTITYTIRDANGDEATASFDIIVAAASALVPRFYVANQPNRIFVYNNRGDRQQANEIALHAANAVPTGVAVTDTRILVVDWEDDHVYFYDRSGTRQNDEEFDLNVANSVPNGLAATDTRIFVEDTSADRVYVYNHAGDLQTSFALDSTRAGGIFATANRVFAVDRAADSSGNRRIYAYTHAGVRQQADEIVIDSTSTNPVGLAVTDTRFYVVDGNTMYVYDRSGTRQNTEEFTLNTANNLPQGLAILLV